MFKLKEMKILKNKFVIMALCLGFILSTAGCNVGTDIVGTGRPSGVSQDSYTSVPEVESKPESESSEIKADDQAEIPYPLEMYFSSGVGAWVSQITINSDGSFVGIYTDGNMGETAAEYPNGTVYRCEFYGRFSKLRFVNEYTYALTLEELVVDGEIGQSVVENGILYKTAYPYGLMNTDNTAPARDFLLYTPDAPIEALRDEFISWWPERFNSELAEKLMLYGLRNIQTDEGFFTASMN